MPFTFRCNTCGTSSDVFDPEHHGHEVDVIFITQKDAQSGDFDEGAVVTTFDDIDDPKKPRPAHKHRRWGSPTHTHEGGEHPHGHATYDEWRDAR